MIKDLIWDERNIPHVKAHTVTPREAEQVCFSKNLLLKRGKNRYAVLGRTQAGRYLFVIVVFQGRSQARVITARDMGKTEKRLYQKKGGP